MASILLLTADPAVVDGISAMLDPHRFRLRNVSSPSAAREWLAMQGFDVLLVDARFGELIPLEILSFAWKHHAMLTGCIIDLLHDFAERWTAQAMGAHTFSGPQALIDAAGFIKSLPELVSAPSAGGGSAVLVVEDIDSPRDIIRAYIEALGYTQVDGAASAEEALRILHDNPTLYFCIVADILMPCVSGIELIRRIRADADQTISSMPVIVLTAVPTTENLIAALHAGVSGFLVKPPKKMALKIELEKAKRIVLTKRSPRLCQEKDAQIVEASLRKLGVG